MVFKEHKLGQDLLLKLDVASVSSGESIGKNKKSDSDSNEPESRPFSSTLDEHIEQQNTPKIKNKTSTASSEIKQDKAEKTKGKEAKEDLKSGNELPINVSEVDIDIELKPIENEEGADIEADGVPMPVVSASDISTEDATINKENISVLSTVIGESEFSPIHLD